MSDCTRSLCCCAFLLNVRVHFDWPLPSSIHSFFKHYFISHICQCSFSVSIFLVFLSSLSTELWRSALCDSDNALYKYAYIMYNTYCQQSKWTTKRIGPSTLTPHRKPSGKKWNRKLEFRFFVSLGSKKHTHKRTINQPHTFGWIFSSSMHRWTVFWANLKNKSDAKRF